VTNPCTAACPNITGWRSAGGHPVHKDNARDLMYSVRPEEPMTFAVKVDPEAEYEWTVNKLTQKDPAPTFAWTVPKEKGIWEIHVAVRHREGESHREWVVSTLSAEEAPDLFEYFADGCFKERQGTDPWGFPLASALTGADGHTPLPEDREHTLILADYVLDQKAKKTFSYTIEVTTRDGREEITRVRPGPQWYRADPRKPAYTVQVVMGR
jgi:hypothetical protein